MRECNSTLGRTGTKHDARGLRKEDRPDGFQNSRHGEKIHAIATGREHRCSGWAGLHRRRATACWLRKRGVNADAGSEFIAPSSQHPSHMPLHLERPGGAETVARQQPWSNREPPMSGVLGPPAPRHLRGPGRRVPVLGRGRPGQRRHVHRPRRLEWRRVLFRPLGALPERDHHQPNCLLAGVVGRGKSMLAKAMATRSIATGRKVYVPGDPKGEWSVVARAVGGVAIELGGGSTNRLNPLDEGPRPGTINSGAWAALVATRRRGLLGSLVESALGRPMTAMEHTALDQGLRSVVALPGTPTLPMVVDAL